MATLPGGATTADLVSLNGLGMLFNASGHYVDPLRWKSGIQGIGDLGAPLTPGLHGLMQFPGSGGNDPLVRNPIHPHMRHAWLTSDAQLGQKNKLIDGMQTAPGATTDGSVSGTNELSNLLTVGWTAKLLGLGGLGCAGACDCGGACGGGHGLGALDLSLQGSLLTGINPSLPAVPNWVLYGVVGYFLFIGTGGEIHASRRRNPRKRKKVPK
jgi:hypothetical protein